MYNENYDKELIEYLSGYFQEQKTGELEQTSIIVGDNTYKIRFKNSEIVLQLLYEAESKDCEAQIRITNILLQGKLRKKGLSKGIINRLVDYCHAHGDMSLWIYDLINQSWCAYLIQHGAIMYQEESQFEGAVILIRDPII